MIKNIQILDDSQRLFDFNEELFKAKYPDIYSNFNNQEEDAYYYLQEKLHEGDDIFNYSNKKDVASIELSHSETILITNVDIHQWYQSNFMDAINIWADELYVYFSIDSSISQAGSIGIWSIDKKDWIFSRCDEGFCVEAVVYDKEIDIFIGFNYWHYPMVDNSGEGFFLIDKNRKYIELKTEKIYSIEERTNESVEAVDSYLPDINTNLKQETALHNFFVVDIKQQLILFYDQSNKKINSAYKFSMLDIV
jgi:hypothetical protein